MKNSHLARVQLLDAIEGNVDFLCLVRGVGNLHDVALGCLIETSGSIETILACYSLAVLGKLQYVGTLVLAVELLNIVVGRTDRAEVIEPDEVRTPLPSLYMSEERCIGSLINHIGITLQTRHESCLRKRSLPRVRIVLGMGSILAGKYLRTLAVVLVVTAGIVAEPLRALVVVLIHHVYAQLAHLLPTVVEVLSISRWTR